MDPSRSGSEGGKPPNADEPSFTFELNVNDMIDDDFYSLNVHRYDHRYMGNDFFDLPSTFLEECFTPDVPSTQGAIELPLEMVGEVAYPPISEMNAFSTPTADIVQGVAEPLTIGMEATIVQAVGVEASSSAQSRMDDSKPLEADIDALHPPVVETDMVGYTTTTLEPMCCESSTQGAPVVALDLAIVPYKPFLPRMILLEEINARDHFKCNDGVKVDEMKHEGTVAASPITTEEMLPTMVEQLPWTDAVNKEAKMEERSPSILSKRVAVDQSTTAEEWRPYKVKPRPSWLPEGWMYLDVPRTSGATAGKVDRYYYSPGGLLRFRSKVEVLFYINHGRVMKRGDRLKTKNSVASDAQLS